MVADVATSLVCAACDTRSAIPNLATRTVVVEHHVKSDVPTAPARRRERALRRRILGAIVVAAEVRLFAVVSTLVDVAVALMPVLVVMVTVTFLGSVVGPDVRDQPPTQFARRSFTG